MACFLPTFVQSVKIGRLIASTLAFCSPSLERSEGAQEITVSISLQVMKLVSTFSEAEMSDSVDLVLSMGRPEPLFTSHS